MPQPQQTPKLPIQSISDVLTIENISQHLDSLSKEQLIENYSTHLPKSIDANNISKNEILDIVRSGFFQQSINKLSDQLTNSNGTGYLLSQSLKYDYQGEGVDGFLNGIRQLSKKEEEEEKKQQEDQNHANSNDDSMKD